MSQPARSLARMAAIAVMPGVLISGAVTAAAANVLSWELRQLARLPLGAGARQVRRPCLELVPAPPGPPPRPLAGGGSGDRRGKLRAVR